MLDPDVSGRVTIVLDQVPWDQALDLILKNNGLDKILEGNVLRIATTQKLAQEAAPRKQLKEAEELEVEPITITRTLSYAKAEDVQQRHPRGRHPHRARQGDRRRADQHADHQRHSEEGSSRWTS